MLGVCSLPLYIYHAKDLSRSVFKLPVTTESYNGMLVPVRTSFNLRRRREKRIMYQLKVDVDKLNAVKVVVS